MFGLKVIFLKYAAKAIIVKYINELIPIGYPKVTSFKIPEININPLPI